MVALSPRTSPASAIFRIRVLPSDAQMESLTRPLHNTKRPRGAWPSTNSTAPLGYALAYLIVSKVCNAEAGRSQKILATRILQLRQFSMMSNPYGVSTTTPCDSQHIAAHLRPDGNVTAHPRLKSTSLRSSSQFCAGKVSYLIRGSVPRYTPSEHVHVTCNKCRRHNRL